MLALIMAGGVGSRLNLGEKPLVSVGGLPMIAHVIGAFETFGCDVVVVTSRKTPMTRNWCRVTGIDMITAEGGGYVEDMVEAVCDLGETAPLFVSVSDVPCLHPGILKMIHGAYLQSGKDACSTWVPLECARDRETIRYPENVGGVIAFPAGINILRGERIHLQQDEFRFLLSEPRLAHNINSRADLEYVNAFFRKDRPPIPGPGR